MKALESQSIYRVVALSTTTPSIRTVVVEANAGWYRDKRSEGAKVDCTVYPVLALRTVVKNMYTKQVRQLPPREPLTHEELLKAGWTFAVQFEQTSALIYDPEKCGILAYDDEDRSNQYNHRYAEVVGLNPTSALSGAISTTGPFQMKENSSFSFICERDSLVQRQQMICP
jgi:hypothetical protein